MQVLAHRPDFRNLWLGTLATQSGQWVLQVAIGWLMLDLTDSAFWVGLTGFAGGMPMLLLAIPAGVATDRFDRRSVLRTCQLGLSVLGLALATAVLLDIVTPWQLLLGAACNGSLMTINNTARQTMIPATVPRQEIASAIAYNTAGQSATRLVGPSLAGFSIAAVGGAGAFGLQAVCLALALLLTLQLPSESDNATTQRRRAPGALEGVRAVRQDRLLRDLILLAGIPTFAVFPYMQLLPVYARDILAIGPQGLGLLLASSGCGAVIGALLVGRTSPSRQAGRTLFAATIAYCLLVLGFAYAKSVWLSAPLLVFAGITGSAYLSLNNAILQMHVTDELRGRVVGVSMLTWGLMPLGALPMGFLAEHVGAPAAIASGVLLAIGLTISLSFGSPLLAARLPNEQV